MSISEGYGNRCVVVAIQSKQLSSPMGTILRGGLGRSWASSDTSNLSGVERKKNRRESI
jgi:hypothetical protein